MKKILIISLLFLLQFSYSQKKFHFNCLLEFENTEGDSKNIVSYLSNSTNNGINMFFLKQDVFTFVFTDYATLGVKSEIKASSIDDFQYINVDCADVFKYKNHFKKKLNDYVFVNLNDTIIDGTFYYHYKAMHKRQGKKDKNVHYIVAKDSPDFMPFFQNQVNYELWKKQPNVPNGIPFLIYHKDYYGVITSRMQLKNYTKIDKYIVIPEDCELN